LGITATEFGRTSITLTCEVRNKITRKSILTVEKMVFVNLGEDGLPAPHGRTEIKYVMPADEAVAFTHSMASRLSPHRYRDSGIEPSAGTEHYATTVYFDTADRELYRAAVYEPVHVKVRAREYYAVHSGRPDFETDPQQIVQSSPVTWIELKSRDGQRSRKRRACIPKLEVPSLLDDLERRQTGARTRSPTGNAELDQIVAELQHVLIRLRSPLRASCAVNYRRLSWQDDSDALRITLDRDVSAFALPADLWTQRGPASRHVLGRPAWLEPSCVLEVKSHGESPAWLAQVLARHRATEVEYSKFVMASRALHGPV